MIFGGIGMKNLKIKIAPSILSADFSNLSRDIKAIEADADLIHVDVMDGHFVPNISFGFPVMKALEKITKLPLYVHLMISNPELYIEKFIDAGADILSFHYEATVHVDMLITRIKNKGAKAFLALNPHTPVENLRLFLSKLDGVLLMTVNPGFGGQKFIDYCMNKIKLLRNLANEIKPDLEIAVDGGINLENIVDIVNSGANVIIMGSEIFGSSNPAEMILKIKERIKNL